MVLNDLLLSNVCNQEATFSAVRTDIDGAQNAVVLSFLQLIG